MFFLYLLPLIFGMSAGVTFTTEGGSTGGYFRRNSNITLKCVDTQDFDRCYIYFPPTKEEKTRTCTMGDGKVIRCKPSELQNRVTYASEDTKVCAIVSMNVTDDAAGTYGCSIDASERETTEVTIVRKIENIEVTIGNGTKGFLKAGERGKITCKISGGKPIGEATIFDKYLDVTSKTNITDTEELSYTLTVFIDTKVQDHKKVISCSGYQEDRSTPPVVLFPPTQARKILNVTFEPQPKKKQTFGGKVNQSLVVNIAFTANPPPDSIKWFKVKEDGSKEEMIEGDTIELSKEAVDRGNDNFAANMTFKSLTTAMKGSKYALTAGNSVGETDYEFTLNVLAKGETTTTTTTTTTTASTTTTTTKPGTGSAHYTVPIVVLFIILLIAGGSVFWYKRVSGRRQTMPMAASGR